MRIEDKPEKIYTVSEITRMIKIELEKQFPVLWIEGEIANFKRAHSGHMYFTLKDENSQLYCVMFRSDAQRVPFELESGLHIICKGRITVYEPRGQYQLLVEMVEPKGKGALQLAFEQLKEKLNKEGLFDPQIKKKIPLLPKKVGVVTSSRGAAIVDIIRTLERRFARLNILIYPVRVQGEGAAEEIVAGIEHLGGLPDTDVIIAGRGGGSLEDLWAFNQEKVARAIHRCPVPIISAVGHEIDFTIADFVADIRASTPSAAAEMVIEKEESFLERIENLEKRMTHHLQYFIQEKRQSILGLVHHQTFQNFKMRLFHMAQQVDDFETRAGQVIQKMAQKIFELKSRTVLMEEKSISAVERILQNIKGVWEKLSAELHSLSPLNILKKGYTLCWKDRPSRLVLRIEEISKGDEVRISFHKGEFRACVQNVDKDRLIGSHLQRGKESGGRENE